MKNSDLKANPKNPRKITPVQLAGLSASMDKFGDLGCVVFNRRTGQLVGGTQRTKVIPADQAITIVQRYDPPSDRGTVAVGFIDFQGERFGYREVDWDKDKETAANIAANKHGGTFDDELLAQNLAELENAELIALTGFDDDEVERLIRVSAHQRTVPNFEPGAAEDQSALDKIQKIGCPHCGKFFEKSQAKTED